MRVSCRFVDPVVASPLETLLIVGVAVIWNCVYSGVIVYFAKTNSGDNNTFARINAVPFIFIYIAVMVYYLISTIKVLRSLTTDKRMRAMSMYVLASATFMIVHVCTIFCFVAKVQVQSEVHYGLIFFFLYLSRAGAALCCISVFYTEQEGGIVFLEFEVGRLVGALEQLAKEKEEEGQRRREKERLKDLEIARLKALNNKTGRWPSQMGMGSVVIYPSMT